MAKKNSRTTFSHIRSEQGRGSCLVCGSPPDSSTECSGRYRSPSPGGPRDKFDSRVVVGFTRTPSDAGAWIRDILSEDINTAAGRPDAWG